MHITPLVHVQTCLCVGAGQLLELHRGQGKEIHWRDSVQCPTEEEYMDMIKQSRPAPPTCVLTPPTLSSTAFWLLQKLVVCSAWLWTSCSCLAATPGE